MTVDDHFHQHTYAASRIVTNRHPSVSGTRTRFVPRGSEAGSQSLVWVQLFRFDLLVLFPSCFLSFPSLIRD